MLLIKNAALFTPSPAGKKDILICGGKIEHIADKIEIPHELCRVLDAGGKYALPGFIDQHVHITGGGGEGGFHTRTPEVQLSELICGGITTVVGLLGTDGATRSMENLYAKTMALNEEGITAYLLTGAYPYPGPSITGDPGKDILFCEKVLGAKLALSDHRSSNITFKELIALASNVRVASMMSGKPGMITLHMGSGKRGLQPVFEALENSDLPIGIFRPTHVGRAAALREEAFTLLGMGGFIDFTCGSSKRGGPGRGIREAINRNLPTAGITVSSDGHGSWSRYGKAGELLQIGVSSVDGLLGEFRHMVQQQQFTLEESLPFFTVNVARALGLLGKKGTLEPHADADILLLNPDLTLDTVIARGEELMTGGTLLRKGTYE